MLQAINQIQDGWIVTYDVVDTETGTYRSTQSVTFLHDPTAAEIDAAITDNLQDLERDLQVVEG